MLEYSFKLQYYYKTKSHIY